MSLPKWCFMRGYYPFMKRNNHLYKYRGLWHLLKDLALVCLEGCDQENYADIIISRISILSWILRILSSWMQYADRGDFFVSKDLFSMPCCTWRRIEYLGKVYSTYLEVSVNLTLSLSWTNCNIYLSNRLLHQQLQGKSWQRIWHFD